MNCNHQSTSQLHARLSQAKVQLHQACAEFVKAKSVCDLIGTQQAQELLASLEMEGGLYVYRSKLRECIVHCLGNVMGFDSSPWWAMIDAITFWDDAHDGRWKYTTEPQRMRWIDWSQSEAAQAVQTMLH